MLHQNDVGFEISSESGVSINKVDKGCLIFNIEKENGYIVAVVDNTNKGAEAKYWTDDFYMYALEKIVLIRPKICYLYARVSFLNCLARMAK